MLLCGSRKYPYSPHGRSKAKPLEQKYDAKLEFPGVEGGGGGGGQNKKPSVGRVWILFPGTSQFRCSQFLISSLTVVSFLPASNTN